MFISELGPQGTFLPVSWKKEDVMVMESVMENQKMKSGKVPKHPERSITGLLATVLIDIK